MGGVVDWIDWDYYQKVWRKESEFHHHISGPSPTCGTRNASFTIVFLEKMAERIQEFGGRRFSDISPAGKDL
jgi:hypothetical protein